ECAGKSPVLPPPMPEEGHVKVGPPDPGDWRARNPQEKAQSFEQYLECGANRKCSHRTTLYIQPLATPPGRRSFVAGAHERHEKAIALMRDHAEIFFSVPAKVLEPIPMFEDAVNPDRGQSHATGIIRHLADRLPKDALVYIGITEDDLYSD